MLEPILILAFLIKPILMVKHSDFKTCNQSSFCVRQRAFADYVDHTKLNWTFTPTFTKHTIEGHLLFDQEEYLGTFSILKNSFRFQLREKNSKRFEPDFSIDNLELNTYTHSIQDGVIQVMFDNTKLVIQTNPFSFKSFVNGIEAMQFNDKGYLYYEPNRDQPRPPTFATISENATQQQDPLIEIKRNLQKDVGVETFNSHMDNKPRGATSFGFDVSFPGSKHVFGIPEHATSFALKSTRGKGKVYDDPYRLYNLDVFEYILDSPMSLYGSVPFMMSHKKALSSGILVMNSAEMWIDIEKDDMARAHWMVESGILDLFVFQGPTQQDLFDQYTRLTGRPQLPQKFSVGYHQCRWNYDSEEDALQVDAKFDEHEIPYDVLWLDIEHTDGKRYFTWDKNKFPNPVEMQQTLSRKGRKMVTIIDPHMKADDDYYVTKNAKPLNIFVKKQDQDFEGHCWPGNSYWIDYTNPAARKYWAEQFLFDNYKGSTPDLYTWNDMNEPSVFSGPEITMPKDLLHHGGVEHRDVHNAYGMLFHRSTYEGHLLRSQNKDRPFILSRAFFIGTQRYGCIWTGDNTGEWKHLAATVPMLLSIGISGITNAGADVGGFFLNPDGELMVRWYQVGSLQPFFRAHAHIETKRREPWLFGEPYTTLMGKAVERRFKMLPYIYTLFEESSRTGNPIMRSMMQEFPNDEKTFGMDDQYMFGPAILVKPVVEAGQSYCETYLPKESNWYDYDLLQPVDGGIHKMKTTLDRIPVYLRGGSIVPRKDRLRRSSNLTTKDPYTLIVALDEKNSAKGSLYIDDGSTFEYKKGQFIRTEFSFENNQLVSKVLNKSDTEFNSRIERIVILGLKQVKRVSIGDRNVEFVVSKDSITIKDPGMSISDTFTLSFE